MIKIKIFLTFLIVHCTLLIGTASAQWWVNGGNLLWPYGDVSIQKDLNVGMNLTVADSIRFNDYASITPYVFEEDGELVDVGFSFSSRLGADQSSMTVFQNGLTFNFGASTRIDIGSYSTIFYANLSSYDYISLNYGFNAKNSIMIRNSATDYATITAGTGSPEGSVGATVGSIYLRTDGGAGTTFYVKESGGNTNTGWVAK